MAAQITEQLDNGEVVTLTDEQLSTLLDEAEIVEDRDTLLCDRIRVLRLDGRVLVQETTDRGQRIVRKVDSLDAAREMVSLRLETYERMWDGCGCKVFYFD